MILSQRFHENSTEGILIRECHFFLLFWSRGGLVVGSRPWGRRAPGLKPDSTEDPTYMGPAARQIIRSGQTPSRWCGMEAWRGGTSSGVVLVI
ncbi:hypothetical protein AVEN_237416-1 [Araneus ventricosus]|uniref:Uncharacterized protein n=1 Tax=Araneus ventricosus TaxID=182803 RepID=A0A4Y2Q0K7_ARAVE|nr:hypothetical protein AVEN_237416-1 [Araneus ventricosus]